MQAVRATLKQTARVESFEWAQLRPAPVSWLTRVFGCWHREMSRPFTLREHSYRVCLECGAHRQFDPQAWEMTGPFYYEQAQATAELYSDAQVEVRRTHARRATRTALMAA
jgi:hypothetical protein